MASTVNIKNLSGFISQIAGIDRKPDHTLFFRGHADTEYLALPYIFRAIPDNELGEKYVDKEDYLFHHMIMQCPEDFHNCLTAFEHLVKMQHYGLPTRLLDITSNPLVALYFACCSLNGTSKDARDGEVLIFQIPNNEIKFYNSDTVSLVSNLAKFSSNFNFNDATDRKRYLHAIKSEKSYFEDLIKEEDLHSVFCVKPKLDNRRIIKQSGAFLIFGMGIKKTDSIRIPENFRSDDIQRIEIGKAAKRKVINELANISISEATLFPEIDNVARFLKA